MKSSASPRIKFYIIVETKRSRSSHSDAPHVAGHARTADRAPVTSLSRGPSGSSSRVGDASFASI
jgi:hypothetical protein